MFPSYPPKTRVFRKKTGVFRLFFAFARRKLLGVFRRVIAADLLSRECLDVEMQPDEAMSILEGIPDYRLMTKSEDFSRL